MQFVHKLFDWLLDTLVLVDMFLKMGQVICSHMADMVCCHLTEQLEIVKCPRNVQVLTNICAQVSHAIAIANNAKIW